MLESFFSKFKLRPETWPVVRDVVKAVVPEPPKPPTDAELAHLLKFMYREFHYFDSRACYQWQRIPAVKVSTTFGGWGYVSGRTKGLKINRRITLTEADDDMDFSELCVLIDSVPSMILYSGRNGPLLLNVISKENEGNILYSLFGGHDIHTVEAFRKMPDPVQNILTDIFRELFRQSGQSPDPTEKVLDYTFGERA